MDAQWIAVVVSLAAFVLAMRRDTRNAKNEDLLDLKRERDDCVKRVAVLEGQVRILREDNLLLMRKVLGLEEGNHARTPS